MLNSLMPGGKAASLLKAAGLSKYVRPFPFHQAVKD